MELHKIGNKYAVNLKYILPFVLAFCTIFSEILIQQGDLNIQLTISSIFIFLIIGLESSNVSLLIITLLNCLIFGIKGFNILTVIQALEIYYVWILYKVNKKNVVIEVLTFWILLALPLILITSYSNNYNFRMESGFFVLIIFLNRIFNALISSILLDYIPFKRILGLNYSRTKTRKLSYMLAHASIGSIVVPIIILFLITNASTQNQISEMAVRDLRGSSEYVNQKVDLWRLEEKNNLKLRNPLQMYDLIEMIKMYHSTSGNSVNFYLLDMSAKVINNDNTQDYMKNGLSWLKKGSLTEVKPNIYKWTAPKENSFIIKNYNTEYAYIYVTTINNLKVVNAVSGRMYASKVIDIYLNLLGIILSITLFVVIFGLILKSIMIRSISKLINITSGLPEKLRNKEIVVFEESNISEINLLLGNIETMSDNFSSMFSKVEASNKRLQESERMLFDQAHYDSLTGLSNRYYFIKYVQEVMDNFYVNEIYADKQGIAFFFIDLDKFKAVNDTFGHSVGDKLLKEVAIRMTCVLEKYDSSLTFIARLGGDEFVIEFIYEDKDEIVELANNIIEVINKPMNIDNNEVTVGTSIGIGLYPQEGEDIESIFIKSDTSMYKAKYSGGNRFLFYASID